VAVFALADELLDAVADARHLAEESVCDGVDER
jgi:hypothetical protein